MSCDTGIKPRKTVKNNPPLHPKPFRRKKP